MQDARGLYYYPSPANRKERMYVRERAGQVEFRLWNQEQPRIWDQHEWLSYALIEQAAAQYSGQGESPLALYDMDVAMTLIREARLRKAQTVNSQSA